MSLLSDTNHTPQRVYALLRLLAAQDGPLAYDAIVRWLKPRWRGGSHPAADEDANIRQLVGATTSLGLIESRARSLYALTAPAPETHQAFADEVHDRLVALEFDHPDSIMLEAFAAMVVVTERQGGVTWIDQNAKDRADMINEAVIASPTGADDDPARRFNSTKSPPWKRWMVFLGLASPMPKSDLYPYPAERLDRELARMRNNGDLPRTIEVEDFLALIGKRMPYLDGGRLFLASAKRIGLPPLNRQVSRVLSGVLRDLHDDGVLVLDTVGDARDTYVLAPEPHPVRAIKTVTLHGDSDHG